jgi:CheY-like chemotaxis protein
MTTSEKSTTSTVAKRRRSPLVLIVDDFEDNRMMYVEYLGFAGYEVEEASTGQEAVDKARSCLPDLVIMDLSLPVMDGWEATRILKADPATKHIPIVALTGHALVSHAASAREAGCDDVLSKPCLPKALLERVETMLAGAKKNGRRERR